MLIFFNALLHGKFFLTFLSFANFFHNQLFRKIIPGIPLERQTD